MCKQSRSPKGVAFCLILGFVNKCINEVQSGSLIAATIHFVSWNLCRLAYSLSNPSMKLG